MDTLYKHLVVGAPSFSDLHKKYDPVLQLVDILIGTIPNCDLVLELWPTSFESYNMLVANLLELPISLFGKKSNNTIKGLAMYESSMAAGCNYCSAHTCSYSLRRGIDQSVIQGDRNEKEKTVVTFARRMALVPCAVTQEDFENLQKHCNEKEIDGIQMGIVLGGYLNKFMDILGIELEQDSIDDVSEVLKGTDWKTGKHYEGEVKVSDQKNSLKVDDLPFYFKVLRNGPGYLKLENKWLKSIPKKSEKIDTYLSENLGHDFPLLNKFKRKKLKRVFAGVLADNFSASKTDIGLRMKVVAGLIFSSMVGNEYLENVLLILAKNNKLDVSGDFHKSIVAFCKDESKIEQFSVSDKDRTIIKFAKEASKSPAVIEETLVKEVVDMITAKETIELASWLAILQALHRFQKLPI